MAARRHHTVPQFYLRNFADPADQVVLVDRDDHTRSHRTAVLKAVSETGFYRIETDDLAREVDRAGHDPEGIESALAALEAEMAPAVRAVVDGSLTGLSDQQWYRLIQFVAVQSVRGHRWRQHFVALATQTIRVELLGSVDDVQIRERLVSQGKPHGPADIAAFREQLFTERFPRVVPPQALLVQESLKMALGNPVDDADLGLGRYLADKTLSLITPPSVPVLTSDEPVCWWSPGGDLVGFASAQLVWVPLSRDRILQFADPHLDHDVCGLPDLRTPEGHDAMAAKVNRLVAAQAERWIIQHPDDFPLEVLDLPPRAVWADELVDVIESDDLRRELYIHRRITPHD